VYLRLAPAGDNLHVETKGAFYHQLFKEGNVLIMCATVHAKYALCIKFLAAPGD
jgi:hypothetical protein